MAIAGAGTIASPTWTGWSSQRVPAAARMTAGAASTRVVTWNLRDGPGPWPDRLPLVLGTLAELWPDVVCLQGAWQPGQRAHADFLASELAMEAVFCLPGAAAESGAGAGLAVLGRWPVTRIRCHALPPHALPRRAAAPADFFAMTVSVDHPSGPLQVTTAVLDGEQDHDAVLPAQARALAAFLADPVLDGPAPVIVAADLSAAWAELGLAALTADREHGWAAASARAAEPAARGRTGHLLVRPGVPERPVAVQAAWLAGTEDPPGSGQHAVVADLTWPR